MKRKGRLCTEVAGGVFRTIERGGTPTPSSKCVKAVDKGVRRVLYGNAERKGVRCRREKRAGADTSANLGYFIDQVIEFVKW